MLFKQMQYFISIVKNNSFTEAAEENYISQSAISQGIKSLEDELGVKLLKRHNRGFTLTDVGKRICIIKWIRVPYFVELFLI